MLPGMILPFPDAQVLNNNGLGVHNCQITPTPNPPNPNASFPTPQLQEGQQVCYREQFYLFPDDGNAQ